MLRYECFGFWLYLAISTGLPFLYSPDSFAQDLSGEVDISNMPTPTSITDHLKWTKIIISSCDGEMTRTIGVSTNFFRVEHIRIEDSLTVSWIWQLPGVVSGDNVTHGLYPLVLKDVSDVVRFRFYDLGSIHRRFVQKIETEIESNTENTNFFKANQQCVLANEFYDRIRDLNSTRWLTQANSWNFILYQSAFDNSLQAGIRTLEIKEKQIVRGWLKNSISLCVEQESLKSRLGWALQSWSRFSKLAYSRVSDWPDTIPQDITVEEVNRVFLNKDFREWMIDDMVWLQERIFSKEPVRTFLVGKPHLIALLPNDSGLGTSLSKFAQAITDFTKEWR